MRAREPGWPPYRWIAVDLYGHICAWPEVPWTIAQRGNEHAAEKPEALFRKAVRLVSDPDAVILDPFAGSGTSGPAALAEGRRVILIERDEEYRDICERRCAASVIGTNWRKPEQGALGGIL